MERMNALLHNCTYCVSNVICFLPPLVDSIPTVYLGLEESIGYGRQRRRERERERGGGVVDPFGGEASKEGAAVEK